MKGVMNSLWMFPTLRKEIDRTKAMDPNYQHGGHARFWSEVVARVPDIALKAVGLDASEPGRDIEAQVKKDPNFFENRVYLALLSSRQKGRRIFRPARVRPEKRSQRSFRGGLSLAKQTLAGYG